MAEQFTVGLRGLLKPEVDDRAKRSATSELQDELEEVEQLQPDVDTSGIQDSFNGLSMPEFDMGDAASGAGAAAGGGGAASAAASGGLLGSAASGGLAKVALGGAVAVGMLSTLGTIKDLTMAASPALQTTSSMFGEAMKLFFRPFGDFLSSLLRPMSKSLLEMAKNFNQNVGENGLTVALAEGLTGVDITDGGLGEVTLGGFGAGAGLAGGAIGGAKAGGAAGAALGSVVPGAGTAAGGTAGAIVGAIVGAISGTAIGGRIGSAIGEKIDSIDVPDMPSIPEFPGWPTIPAFSWPELPEFTWPRISAGGVLASISWPSIDTDGLLGQASWPSLDAGDITGSISWPGIPSTGILTSVNWPSVGSAILLASIAWPSIGTNNLLNMPSWPSINGSAIVDSINWPTISASDITGKLNLGGGGGGSGGGGGGLSYDGPGSNYFASGAIVKGPTNAVIGESGPEAVIPLDQLGREMDRTRSRGRSSSGEGGRSTEELRQIGRKLDDLNRNLQRLDTSVTLKLDGEDVSQSSKRASEKYRSSRVVSK